MLSPFRYVSTPSYTAISSRYTASPKSQRFLGSCTSVEGIRSGVDTATPANVIWLPKVFERVYKMRFEAVYSKTNHIGLLLSSLTAMSEELEQCKTERFVRTCLTCLQRVGLALIAESGVISFVALMILFGLIVRNIVRYYRYLPGSEWRLIQTPADAYVLSLFIADLLQSIGGSMDIKWAHEGSVQIGRYCTVAGAIQQIGQTAVAFSTGVIAVHTFVVVWMRKGAHNLKVAYLVIACTWLYVILYASIAVSTKHDFYNPDPFWCWVGNQYLKDKIAGEYVWLWITVVVSFIVYFPLFLWSRGNIAVDAKHWWKVKWRWRARPANHTDTTIRERPDVPYLTLLSYPIAYSIIVTPLSIARWASFTGHNVPDAATFFALFLHRLFGAVNVVLLLITRPNLLLFTDPRVFRKDCENGSVVAQVGQTNDRVPSPSDTRSVTSIRTAEEMRENSSHSASIWAAGTGGMSHDDFGDLIGARTGTGAVLPKEGHGELTSWNLA